MSLIKCPECKNEVSTMASTCPHCGYPINNITVKKDYKELVATEPLQNGWVYKWNKKPVITKLIVFALFAIHIVLLFVFLSLLINDKETSYSAYTGTIYFYEKTEWIIATVICGFLSLTWLVILITSLLMIKTKVRTSDGYNIVVYCGFWKNYLVIENFVVESNFGSSFHNTILTGELPNKKEVIVTLSSGAINIQVN